MTLIENLEEEILNKENEISEKQDEIDTFELDSGDYENQFDDMLDEMYDSVFGQLPSKIMSTLDPIMYNVELGYYVDSLDVTENADYQELEEELNVLNDELEQLQEDLEEAQNEEE